MNVNKERPLNWKAPAAFDPVVDSTQPINVGAMSTACEHCGALFWKEENKWCCRNGKVKFKSDDLPPPVPDVLFDLLMTNTPEAREFREKDRRYNAALSMTSIGITETMPKKASENQDEATRREYGVFTVCGEIHHWHVFVFLSSTVLFLHRIGPLTPEDPDKRKYAQIYFCENESAELETRMRNNEGLNKETMQKLQTMLHEVNPYVKMYETARERLGTNAEESFRIEWFTDIGGINQRRYNAPQATEVGAIMTGTGGESMRERHVIVQPRQGPLKHISIFNSCYDPMHYVIIFPYGTSGWSTALNKATARSRGKRDDGITIMQFYKYMLGVRPGAEPLMPYAYGRLGHQYVLDMFNKIEMANLLFIENNQEQIRAAAYQSAFS